MSLHTARVALEKLTSHQPAAVHLCGLSKGIDMKMYQVEITAVEEGVIAIEQDCDGRSDTVFIHVDQAELVCDWIKKLASSHRHEN